MNASAVSNKCRSADALVNNLSYLDNGIFSRVIATFLLSSSGGHDI
jgi:hypothetical protein